MNQKWNNRYPDKPGFWYRLDVNSHAMFLQWWTMSEIEVYASEDINPNVFYCYAENVPAFDSIVPEG